MTPWHVGTDHPAELALTLVLAFGPFIILGVVIVVQRRRDAAAEAGEAAEERRSPGEG